VYFGDGLMLIIGNEKYRRVHVGLKNAPDSVRGNTDLIPAQRLRRCRAGRANARPMTGSAMRLEGMDTTHVFAAIL
jgi:hypothetical protein